jgi:peptide/nickel transport system substrate-binding protein
MRLSRGRKVMALAAGSALALALAACGNNGGGGSADPTSNAGGELKPLVFGTTDAFGTVDPAGSYDNPGWEMLYNIGQTLLSIPPKESQPEPDAAEKCDFTDPKTYVCTLRAGLKFADGSALDSADVKATFDRMIKIADANGPSSIFADQLATTEATDATTVTFKLKIADTTWPYRLTTAAATIVPEEYAQDKLQESTPETINLSGVYKVQKYDPSQQIILVPNENYQGSKERKNSQVLVQLFKDEASLKTAVESGDVQVAYRSLNPTLVKDLQDNGAGKGVKVVTGDGTGISYLVMNNKKAPFDKKEVRQAVAALIDRSTIATQAYNDTVQPLYTMVPKGMDGHVEAFKDAYGDKPDTAKAKTLLQTAGVTTPVKVQIWYSPDHYGEASADMYQEIERQLEAESLFDVELKTIAWEQYKEQYAAGAFQAFQLGWFPDFPDPDNYLSPFYATNNFIGDGLGYSDKKADDLLTAEKTEQDAAKRKSIMEELQTYEADVTPIVPIWQDKMIAAVRDGVTGVEDTFDPLYTFRFWLVDTTKAK